MLQNRNLRQGLKSKQSCTEAIEQIPEFQLQHTVKEKEQANI